MRAIVQRVSYGKVKVHGQIIGQCREGFVVLAGFTQTDNETIVAKMAEKIAYLRVFEDDNNKMNRSILDIKGEILSISQFTLYANCTHGRRPSFVEAMEPITANRLYMVFNEELRKAGIKVETGQFQAAMEVELLNNGPVTIILDSNELFQK